MKLTFAIVLGRGDPGNWPAKFKKVRLKYLSVVESLSRLYSSARIIYVSIEEFNSVASLGVTNDEL